MSQKDKFLFFLIKAVLFPCRFFSHSFLHTLGKSLGVCLFYSMKSYRKRALSNLALATDLHLTPKQMRAIAKQSFQNLAITCLEYPKFSYEKDLSKSIICENPQTAYELIKEGKGIVFFCGHQSNWEVLFLDGTQHMPGVAIGRPIKNPLLYSWIVSIRQRFGGTIITPRNAIKEGLRALKKGKFLGIVGDQGMPDSGFFCDFLGRKAWTSPSPALLAYKTQSPLMVATTRRHQGKYFIRYSDPIWPDLSRPLEEEVPSMMKAALKLFEKSIHLSPGEWLWQHNRWKQETPKTVYYRYRYDAILVILPSSKEELSSLLPHLPVLREIYPLAFMTLALPEADQATLHLPDVEIFSYKTSGELFMEDYRYKLVFNFTSDHRLKKHFLRLSAFKVLSLEDLKLAAQPHLIPNRDYTLSDVIKRALCRPGTLWDHSPISQNEISSLESG
jgi:KDO2-lipid IV(A) lauroyltransferase